MTAAGQAALASATAAKASEIATVIQGLTSIATVGATIAAGATGVQSCNFPGNQISPNDELKLRQIIQFRLINEYCKRYLDAPGIAEWRYVANCARSTYQPAPFCTNAYIKGGPTGAPTAEAIDAVVLDAVKMKVQADVSGLWQRQVAAPEEYIWSAKDTSEVVGFGITGAIQFTDLTGMSLQDDVRLGPEALRLGLKLDPPGWLAVHKLVGGRLDIGPSMTSSHWDDLAINISGNAPIIDDDPISGVTLRIRTNWKWDGNTTFWSFNIFVFVDGKPFIQPQRREGKPDTSKWF